MLGLSKAWYGNYNNQVTELGGGSNDISLEVLYDDTLSGSYDISSTSASTFISRLDFSNTSISVLNVPYIILFGDCTATVTYTRVGSGSKMIYLNRLYTDTIGSGFFDFSIQSNSAGTFTNSKTNKTSGMASKSPNSSISSTTIAYSYANSSYGVQIYTTDNYMTSMYLLLGYAKNDNYTSTTFPNITVSYTHHVKVLAAVIQ